MVVQAAVEHLFPQYMQPLRDGQQLQSAQLYKRIQREVQLCCQQLLLQQGATPAAAAQQPPPPQQPQQQQQVAECAATSSGGDVDQQQPQQGQQGDSAAARRASSSGLAFELPYISKFLLLAAYIASRNKPTSDRAVFDPTYKKRGRRDAQAHDRQVGGWVGG
jgi:origin recognition complex subunit 5